MVVGHTPSISTHGADENGVLCGVVGQEVGSRAILARAIPAEDTQTTST